MGRTGDWFGYEYSGVTPDVITLAKGLGGGLPLSAMIACGASSYLFQPGDHGSTFGGNPITTAASLATIKFIEKNQLMAAVKRHEKQIMQEVALIPGVSEVRGAGLLIAIELTRPIANNVLIALRNNGVLVNAPTPTTIRIAPALTVTTAQIATFIRTFGKVMSDAN
jgi:acetylornithine aminotransferase